MFLNKDKTMCVKFIKNVPAHMGRLALERVDQNTRAISLTILPNKTLVFLYPSPNQEK